MNDRWLQIIEQLAPVIVAATVPGSGPVLASVITMGIKSAQALKNSPSSQEKFAHAVEIANETAAGINAVKPNTLDTNLVNQTAISVTSAIVDAANMVHNIPVHNVVQQNTQPHQ